ncbi:NUDIX hydrolase [Streptomyces qinzhouensis]|uniref:NUDIX hydrolase n=1 Tax=Streptomyces qinzhouensis TaxID=2599401 RepID=A0A5B8JJC6_9ACTN|nr:NUDIX hydrolase [Streptomyces qinzhouensis]QDY77623.1 NUDIX hydrolase [Streptomyces qinzhouensis]
MHPRHDDTTPVLAAGCVLWRAAPGGAEGEVELCLVHRPQYDDWSHPKGKLKPAEEAYAGALRETLEETGMECALGAPLPTVRYLADGRPKEVRYWAAEATGGSFTPNHEVDRVVWLPPAAARARLSQERDRELVTALLAALRG